MSSDLPEFYFRIREHGAAVFRVDAENRQRRLEMSQIAVANTRNGDIKPHGQHTLTGAERAAIADWISARQRLIARRQVDDILRTVDHLNLTAQWAQAKANKAALEEVTDALLLAMHDLRSVLVRRKAERMAAHPPRGQVLATGTGGGSDSDSGGGSGGGGDSGPGGDEDGSAPEA